MAGIDAIVGRLVGGKIAEMRDEIDGGHVSFGDRGNREYHLGYPASMERTWILDDLGADAFEQLAANLPGTQLQSVLLEVMRRRARARTPRDVLTQYGRDGFVQPAAVDLRTSLAIDTHLLAAADAFEAIDLSPVAPLGTCSTVALTDQNRVLSALRGTEVVSDPTNVLALECASRLRRDHAAAVHIATAQRVIRTQPIPKHSGFTPHFRIFVLASGGREQREHGLAVEALRLHITTMLRALDRLEQHGFRFGARRLAVLARPPQDVIADRVAATLPITCERAVLEHPYYSGGIRYRLWVTAPDGAEVPLIDGGLFDWLATLTANRRNVFVASGMGAGLVGKLFRA